MLSTFGYRQYLRALPKVSWKSFLFTIFLSLHQLSQSAGNVDQLEGEAGFRMASLHWKYSSTEKVPNSSFRIRYCEVQVWGLHRCRYQVVESNSQRSGRQQMEKEVSSTSVSVEIGGLRMATNYSFQVLPQESGLKAGPPSQIELQTKGFSAKATKCLADSSEVVVETGPFFGGRISVDESEVPGCFVPGDPTSPKTQYVMKIKHGACGSHVNGSKVSTMILVQENLPILTHSTRKFVVLCSFSPESFVVKTGVTLPRDASVAKSLDFSGIIRLNPQGTNLLIADNNQLPRKRGSGRYSQSQSASTFTPVDESDLANDNSLQVMSSETRRQSRAFFQTHAEGSESSPSAAAAVQSETIRRHGGRLRDSGWGGFLVLGLVSMGIIASVSSLIWFVKSYQNEEGTPSEDGMSESSSVTDDLEGPCSISSIDSDPRVKIQGDAGRIPRNLDTRSELEVELDFEFSEERNASLILRNYNCQELNPSNFLSQPEKDHKSAIRF